MFLSVPIDCWYLVLVDLVWFLHAIQEASTSYTIGKIVETQTWSANKTTVTVCRSGRSYLSHWSVRPSSSRLSWTWSPMIVLNIAYTISIMSMKKRHQICLQMFEGSRLDLKENIDTALKSTVFIPASFSQTYRTNDLGVRDCETSSHPRGCV